MFSQRSACSSDENAISEAKRNLLASGRKLLDLTKSNPTDVQLPRFDALPDLMSPAGLDRYEPEPFGHWTARQCLADRWLRQGHRVSADNILLTASTSEAYGFLFKLLCDPGDVLLVPTPSYPLFEHLARLEHCELSTYPLLYDGAWHIDLDALRRAVTARTRAILLVCPNNPTGSIVSAQEQEAIAELGLPIISDEVFSGFLFGAATTRYRSSVAITDQLVFVLDGLSKSMGLPQCKLGFTTIAGAPSLVREARARLEIIADSYLSAGTPVQLALPRLLSHEAQRRAVITERLTANLTKLRELTRDSAVTPLTLDGGWSAMLEVPKTRTETEWVHCLMTERGVLTQPGWFFDMPREAFLVTSLLTEPEVFEAGIAEIVDAAQS